MEGRRVGTQITDAVLVMALGMGGVFVFLVLLVGVMRLLDLLAPAVPSSAPRSGSEPGSDDRAVVAAMEAAVTAYEEDSR